MVKREVTRNREDVSARQLAPIVFNGSENPYRPPVVIPLVLFGKTRNVSRQLKLVAPSSGKPYSNNRIRGILFEPLIHGKYIEEISRYLLRNDSTLLSPRLLTRGQIRDAEDAEIEYQVMMIETASKIDRINAQNRKILKRAELRWYDWQSKTSYLSFSLQFFFVLRM